MRASICVLTFAWCITDNHNTFAETSSINLNLLRLIFLTLPYLFNTLWCHSYTHSITNVEAQRFIGSMLVETYSSVCLRKDVHINNWWNLPEILWLAYRQAWFVFWVGSAWVGGAESIQAKTFFSPLEGIGCKNHWFILLKETNRKVEGRVNGYGFMTTAIIILF